MASSKNEALVFGASGLIGWSVVNQILSVYPEAHTFSKVTAVVNRPLAEPDFRWPAPSPSRPELQLVSGVNLFDSTADDLTTALGDKINGAENITHVFYFVFKQVDDQVKEAQTNCEMMGKVVHAVNTIAPGLKSFVYSGGTRGYGIYDPKGVFQAPLTESMADMLPEDYAKTVAYPFFRELLSKECKGKSWTWTEVCPDAVIGFTPHGSGYSLALHWAQYLSLLAYNYGTNSEANETSQSPKKVPFPGNQATYNAKFSPVSSQTLGRASIHAALNPSRSGGKILNVADRREPTCFRDIWPSLAAWFGFEGVEPAEENDSVPKPGEYVAQNRHLFKQAGRPKAVSAGVGVGAVQLDSVGWWLGFDRQLSLERLRSTGFDEELNPINGWLDAFERFRETGIII